MTVLVLVALWMTPVVDGIITPDEPTPVKATSGMGPSPAHTAAATPSETKPKAPVATAATAVLNTGAQTQEGVKTAAKTTLETTTKAQSDGKIEATKPMATESSDAPTPTATSASPSNQAPSSSGNGGGEQSPPVNVEKKEAVVHREVHEPPVRSGGDYLDDELDDREFFVGTSYEIEDSDKNAGKRQNYASLDAGATILDSSPELKSTTSLLVPDKDRYMLMPCEKPRKWVVVSLSEDVHADAISIANYEKFSSTIKEFLVLGSVNYPTDTWFVLGNFTAAQQNGEQIFHLDSQHHVRYIKLRFFSHYGSEYYCTLSQLKVYGRTFTQVISQLEKEIEADVVLESNSMNNLPPSSTADPSPSHEEPSAVDHDEENASIAVNPDATDTAGENSAQCPVPVERFYTKQDASEQTAALPTSPRIPETCSADTAPGKPTTTAVTGSRRTEEAHSDRDQPDRLTPAELAELESSALAGHHVDHHVAPQNQTNKSNASSPSPPATAAVPALPVQGLGRLESIFVRITKKIQQLEVNHSVVARQLDEVRAATTSLQTKQDRMAVQMQEIRSLLLEVRGRVDRDLTESDKTLRAYKLLVEEIRKDNIALWNEMLMVREVITTMKAGILCAIVLSVFVIVIYLLRLLFRCVKNAKRRADVREWFWRLESASQASQDEEVEDETPVGGWRVNHKKQFGSSWDDLALERKTMLRELVDGTQTVDGRGNRRIRKRRMRTASLVTSPALRDLMAQMQDADSSDYGRSANEA
ncbi:hypothetical protein Poli38472_014181 [Pythium oligandrum]|uniref:SUN domain-containing protein n=1 Tax=Pythium oligandrum TaxID=41045 RepID=A0A8K1FKD1_PYTOL|nr:hypothetical protein Poli38472_014181 [Pythium oligandrum]|eukprot:TMW64064.1 hypothetical protein Poli38472_014181 [Pythium oligandrum]